MPATRQPASSEEPNALMSYALVTLRVSGKGRRSETCCLGQLVLDDIMEGELSLP
jgi:hypothetical protein